MNSTNIIRKFINNQIKVINESDSGNYPPGAANDPNAPYNRAPEPEVSHYDVDYANQKFLVSTTNRKYFEVDFVDALEPYWRKNPGSYRNYEQQFGEDMDMRVVEILQKQNPNYFKDYLADIGNNRNLIN